MRDIIDERKMNRDHSERFYGSVVYNFRSADDLPDQLRAKMNLDVHDDLNIKYRCIVYMSTGK